MLNVASPCNVARVFLFQSIWRTACQSHFSLLSGNQPCRSHAAGLMDSTAAPRATAGGSSPNQPAHFDINMTQQGLLVCVDLRP